MVYSKQDSQRPVLMDEAVYRSGDVLEVFPSRDIVDTVAKYSDPVQCAGFRRFLLYLYIDSTSTPTTLHIEVEFLNPRTGKWHTYKQGLFASLYYEDTDVASGVYECFSGLCAGREFRLKITGAGTTSSAYFTISASVEFWN